MERKIKSFRDLEVWKKSMFLVKQTYQITQNFPSSEMFGLTGQMRRAATSVPANIAEGYGRDRTKNYVQFLKTSHGSLFELETFIEISRDLEFPDENKFKIISTDAEEIDKMLNSLINKLSTYIKNP